MNDFKKVLLVGPYPPPYGGIASHIVKLVPDLINDGFEVFIFSQSKRDSIVKEEGFTIFNINLRKKITLLLNPLNINKNVSYFIHLKRFKLGFIKTMTQIVRTNIIIKLVKQHRIKLISFYEISNGRNIPILRKILGVKIPIVLTIYAFPYSYYDFYHHRIELVKSILDNSEKVLSSSKYCARSVELLGIDSSGIEALYYGVDLINFSPKVNRKKIRRDLNIRNEDKILLFVGRLMEVMGLDSILNIIPDILAQRKNIVFLIVGTKGPLERYALNMQEKYKNRVYVRVDLPFVELPYYYAACDIVLAPTRNRHACMGMAIKEAMASGKPVIASDTGGIAEAVVDKNTGILITTKSDLKVDKEVFCKTIFELLDNSQLLKQMGKNARRRAEKVFDCKSTSKRTIDIFNTLLRKEY